MVLKKGYWVMDGGAWELFRLSNYYDNGLKAGCANQ